MPVAVLVVNYRTYDALDRCLTSLEPHLASGDEVIVVDAESLPARVESIAARHPRARWLPRPENTGFAAGVNRAAAAANAPVLLLLNPDTEVEGPVVRALEQWLADHPACGAVGPRVLNADGTVQPSARRFPGLTTALGGRSTWLTRRWPNNWFSRRNLLRRDAGDSGTVDWVSGACLATPRDVFTKLGGLDEGFFLYWEDADYCRRVGVLGLHSDYLPTATIRHRGGASSFHNVTPSIRAFHRSAFRLYWKHSGAGRLVAPLVWLGLMLRGELRVFQARR